ncbi:MAG: hypothetical protein JSV50_08315 [Desulfobacteraceae bacterium]|nr:MAG: hypothetical protein JSV50_08315 [Desulfobacteraceae bacterium]
MNIRQLRELAKKHFQEKTNLAPETGQVTIEWENEQLIQADESRSGKYSIRIIGRKVFEEITVRLDAENGSLLSWSVNSRYQSATATSIDRSSALKIVSEFTTIPHDAVLEEFSQERAPDSHITNIFWSHMVNNLEVEGDAIAVQINSMTGKVISITKIWNTVEETEDKISMDDARKIALGAAPKYVKEQSYEATVVGQKYIPVVENEQALNPKYKLAKVWTAYIIEDIRPFSRITELSINCSDGRVVRVEYSK